MSLPLKKSSFSLATETRVREASLCILKVALGIFRTIEVKGKVLYSISLAF